MISEEVEKVKEVKRGAGLWHFEFTSGNVLVITRSNLIQPSKVVTHGAGWIESEILPNDQLPVVQIHTSALNAQWKWGQARRHQYFFMDNFFAS